MAAAPARQGALVLDTVLRAVLKTQAAKTCRGTEKPVRRRKAWGSDRAYWLVRYSPSPGSAVSLRPSPALVLAGTMTWT